MTDVRLRRLRDEAIAAGVCPACWIDDTITERPHALAAALVASADGVRRCPPHARRAADLRERDREARRERRALLRELLDLGVWERRRARQARRADWQPSTATWGLPRARRAG